MSKTPIQVRDPHKLDGCISDFNFHSGFYPGLARSPSRPSSLATHENPRSSARSAAAKGHLSLAVRMRFEMVRGALQSKAPQAVRPIWSSEPGAKTGAHLVRSAHSGAGAVVGR